MGLLTWQAGLEYQRSGNIGSQVRHNGVEHLAKVTHNATAESEPGLGADWATYWSVYSAFNAADILDGFATEYPQWAAQGFEIAGYVWWPGYGDRGEPAASLYRGNMARFIKQIRSCYESRYPAQTKPNAPFVLSTLATDGGWSNTQEGSMKVAQAQLDVPKDVLNVKTMEARGFWRDASISPSNKGYHYNWNAETCMLAGDALGRAMVELLGNVAPPPAATRIGCMARSPETSPTPSPPATLTAARCPPASSGSAAAIPRLAAMTPVSRPTSAIPPIPTASCASFSGATRTPQQTIRPHMVVWFAGPLRIGTICDASIVFLSGPTTSKDHGLK